MMSAELDANQIVNSHESEKSEKESKSTEIEPEESSVKKSDSQGFSWYNSWLQQAKEKTWSTYELVKKDLGEFTEVVQTEARNVASATAGVIRDQASHLGNLVTEDGNSKEGSPKGDEAKDILTLHDDQDKTCENEEKKEEGSSFFAAASAWVNPTSAAKFVHSLAETVNKALIVEDTTEGEELAEVPITADSFGRSRARLYAIQTDPGTFANEPEGASELFEDWLENFNLEDRNAEISELLGKNPHIRTLYSQLVPSQISNATFWQRYFYKVHLFELDEARRSALLKRSAQFPATKDNLETRTSWGEDEIELLENFEKPETADDMPNAADVSSSLPSDKPVVVTAQPSSALQQKASTTVANFETSDVTTVTKKMSSGSSCSGLEANSPHKTDTVVIESPEHDCQGGTNPQGRSRMSEDSWSVCSGKEMIEISSDCQSPENPADLEEDSRKTAPTPTASEPTETIKEEEAAVGGEKKKKKKKKDGKKIVESQKETANSKQRGKEENDEEDGDWVDWDN